ncbi:MAG: GspH/FimT family protein [Methylomonas sp.]
MNDRISDNAMQRGITLVELLVVLAVIAILAAIAVPSFTGMMQRQRIEGAAEGLVAALQNAKAEAIKTNNSAGVVFMPNTVNTDLATWCYGIQLGAVACDCTASPNNCAAGSVVASTDFRGIVANFNSSNDRTFSPLRGTMSGGATVTFSAGNDSLGVSTNTFGRVRICRPAGTTMPTYTDSGAC